MFGHFNDNLKSYLNSDSLSSVKGFKVKKNLMQSSVTYEDSLPLAGQSGAGNNWAKGHYTEGAELVDSV